MFTYAEELVIIISKINERKLYLMYYKSSDTYLYRSQLTEATEGEGRLNIVTRGFCFVMRVEVRVRILYI